MLPAKVSGLLLLAASVIADTEYELSFYGSDSTCGITPTYTERGLMDGRCKATTAEYRSTVGDPNAGAVGCRSTGGDVSVT